MLIFGMSFMFVGLQIMDFFFDFKWREFSIGLIFLSSLITIISLMDNNLILMIIWFLVTLIEYRSYMLED